MKLQEIMTHSVQTLNEDATLRQAAQRMRELDVGAMPVARGGEPIGIVTDRDIAVRGVAEGYDPGRVIVADIMTTDITACHVDDEVQDVAALMRSRQIRRVLVLDDHDRLCGIVSLADLALRLADDQLSEQVLEEVSMPTHPSRQHATPSMFRRGSRDAAYLGGSAMCSLAAGAAGGAAMMYLFDPQRGRRRRALLRDQFNHLSHRAAASARRTAWHTSDRTRGLIAEAAARFRHDDPSDVVLSERVRSAIGRAVSHPGAVDVDAGGGVVTLRGPVLADEVEHLLAAVERVRGVHKVEDHLEVHASRENIPALQGKGRNAPRDGHRSPGWTASDLVGGIAGAAMASWGAARRDLVGAGVGLVGASIAARSLAPRSSRRSAHQSASHDHINIHKTIRIDAPLEAVFDFWSNVENFPRFMTNVRDVKDYGDGRSHWVVAGPAGTTFEWDAEMTQYIPSELIAWKSDDNATVQSAGTVRFRPDRLGGTRIDVDLVYHPPGGMIGHAFARAFGADPKSEMDQDLMRMKTMIETGHAPHDAARKGGAAPVV